MDYNDSRAIDKLTPSCWDPNNSTGNWGQMAQGLFVEHGGDVWYEPYKNGPQARIIAGDHSIHEISFYQLLDDTTATGLRAMYKIPNFLPPEQPFPLAPPPPAPQTAQAKPPKKK